MVVNKFKLALTCFLIPMLGTIYLPANGLTQGDSWIEKEPLPHVGRYHAASCELDGKIYVMGGMPASTWQPVKTVDVYDTFTNRWTDSKELPMPLEGASACAIDGKIYLFGGRSDADLGTQQYLTDVHEFNPGTQNWTSKAPLPTAKAFFCALAVDGKIYTVGGRSNNNCYPRDIEVYDPATNTWCQKGVMPEPRNEFGAALVNGKIYLIGGKLGCFTPALSTVWEFDPIAETWTRKKNMQPARFGLAAESANGKIYVMGGIMANIQNQPSSTITEEYDPVTDTWKKRADMNTPRAAFCSDIVNNKIYVISGALSNSSFCVTRSVEEYTTLRTDIFNNALRQTILRDFKLYQNFPNPLNSSTTISYSLATDSYANLILYNMLGQVVTVLVDGYQAKGVYHVKWDAKHQPSGIYLCKLEAGGFSTAKKMFLQK